jgi:hypothetical protein
MINISLSITSDALEQFMLLKMDIFIFIFQKIKHSIWNLEGFAN